jgi:hypothetical protein
VRRRLSCNLDGCLAETYRVSEIARHRNPANRMDNIANKQTTCQYDQDEGEEWQNLKVGYLT